MGLIDYKTKAGNDSELTYAMRKKRLAFAKFAFLMSIVGIILVDTPTPNCIFPLLLGSFWNTLKLGT